MTERLAAGGGPPGGPDGDGARSPDGQCLRAARWAYRLYARSSERGRNPLRKSPPSSRMRWVMLPRAIQRATRCARPGSIGVLGLIFGDFAGGALVLFLAEQLIEAKYSQGAESDADVFAYSVLAKAGVCPLRARGDVREVSGKIGRCRGACRPFPKSSPHLATGSRPRGWPRRKGLPRVPILSEAEWVALKGICAR